MVVIECTAACGWKTADRTEAFAAVLAAELANHTAVAHPAATAAPAAPPFNIKIELPKITSGISARSWATKLREWDEYKLIKNIPTNQQSTYLLQCCDKQIKEYIRQSLNGKNLTKVSEAEMIKSIEKIAVLQESILSHRLKASQLVQKPGMGIRQFYAALKNQVELGSYHVNCVGNGCNKSVDVSDVIIKDHLLRGIRNKIIRNKLLSDTTYDTMTCSELVEAVATMENVQDAQRDRGAVSAGRERSRSRSPMVETGE